MKASFPRKVWDHFGAAGDEEKFVERQLRNSIEGAICLPDAQGIPVPGTFTNLTRNEMKREGFLRHN